VETAELERACRRRLAVLLLLRGGREVEEVFVVEEERAGEVTALLTEREEGKDWRVGERTAPKLGAACIGMG
jgi:hypothetical protein